MVRGDDFYLTAFPCLGTERSFPGNGIGPIPWSKAWDYGARHGLPPSMCNYFAMVILVLDGHFRDHLRDEQDKERQREARHQRREERVAKDAPVRSRRGRRQQRK